MLVELVVRHRLVLRVPAHHHGHHPDSWTAVTLEPLSYQQPSFRHVCRPGPSISNLLGFGLGLENFAQGTATIIIIVIFGVVVLFFKTVRVCDISSQEQIQSTCYGYPQIFCASPREFRVFKVLYRRKSMRGRRFPVNSHRWSTGTRMVAQNHGVLMDLDGSKGNRLLGD